MKRKLLQNLTVLAVLTIIFISPVLATNYYVDAVNGNNSNNGLSAGAAKLSIQAASNLTNPGDTVFIMNGTYIATNNSNQSIVTITRSGTAGNYITYKPFPGHTPKMLHLSGLTYQVWRAIAIKASYIVIDGIEIEGANASLNYADAYQTWQDYENGIKDWPKISSFNCGSIDISGSENPHHVIIRNCKIHDTGGGIGGSNCDYITIENNLVYNNCWYSMYAGSGMSILDPKSIDTITSYKMFIRNNIVHNNKTLIPWERINALSDGNGIILDVNIGNGTTVAPYIGRYLVENNVSYNNGGGGVHAYKAAHVDIINNTAYNNGTVVGYPEIDANQCSDVKIYNNIMYARTGGNCNGNDANTIYDYNLYYNGPAYKKGPHDITVTTAPQFENRATDATADFRLKNTNPALNNGSNIPGQFAQKDIVGVSRPVGFSTDMGAYEFPTVVPRTEMIVRQGSTEIIDNTGSFDFGDVASTTPKTVTFTIENIGDLALNLTGTPKVSVAGPAYSITTDAPATVAANGSATFQVTLTTAATGVYTDTIRITNSDGDENPYNFAITGYGYDGTKVLQTITFYELPIKVTGSADFDPGATSSAGLPITYTSSRTTVATIVAGKIHLVGAGTATITANQAGDANTNLAKSVSQLLTVTPVLPPPGTNMITNPTFDLNTTGWSFANKNGGAATAESIGITGSTTNVGKVIITSLGTSNSSDHVQFGTNVFVVKDRNYLISFKASADSIRTIGINVLMNASPFSSIFSKGGIALTTTQTTYGTYAFTSSYTGSVAFRFNLGGNLKTVYLDDVSIIEEAPIVLPVSLLSFTGTLQGGKAVLNWITASEINAARFEVEKSFDGREYAPIGIVAANNILNGSSYHFTDNNILNGTMFYRLKSVDKDGSFKYSKIVLIKMDKRAENTIKIFPNPVIDNISISYPTATANTSVSIFLADGKKIGEYKIAAGSTQRSLDVAELGRGLYIIVYKNDGITTTGSFLK
ncbi:MAG: choice-of-anchor D domain-containing protein [Ferruginibacter sp.]|nr:choice-of-anchor D domain-containing protein [Ferruginibacter sp.]